MGTNDTAYKNAYNRENYDRVKILFPIDSKEKIKAEAAKRGLSVNELIVRALEEKYNLNLHK